MCNVRKTNGPILRKLSDGWTDSWTDGRTDRRTNGLTDESDFIGRCRTNVKLPTEILDQGGKCIFKIDNKETRATSMTSAQCLHVKSYCSDEFNFTDDFK